MGTFQITCEASAKCEGVSQKRDYTHSITSRTVTYKCADSCQDQDLLLAACCDSCQKNQEKAKRGEAPFDQVATEVFCPGCESAQLNSIKKDRCKAQGDGFECVYDQKCEAGEPVT